MAMPKGHKMTAEQRKHISIARKRYFRELAHKDSRCSEPDCISPRAIKGLCRRHYDIVRYKTAGARNAPSGRPVRKIMLRVEKRIRYDLATAFRRLAREIIT